MRMPFAVVKGTAFPSFALSSRAQCDRKVRQMQAQRFALLFFLLVPCALAQTPPAAEYEPQLWQAGKDVVWVPMADDLVARMLDLAKVTAEDFVMDLGSGDGRTVIAAAKRGAHSLGVEFNPDLVAYSRRAA